MEEISVFVRYTMWSKKYRKYIPAHCLCSNQFRTTRGDGKTSSTGIQSRLDFRRKFVFRVATRMSLYFLELITTLSGNWNQSEENRQEKTPRAVDT